MPVQARKEISSEELKTLGINEEKFRRLSPKEQHTFLRLHALEDSIILKSREQRERPDPNKTYKTSFRQILDYMWVPYRGLFLITVFLSIIQALLFLMLPLMLQQGINHLLETRDLMVVVRDFLIIVVILGCMAVLMYIRIYMNNWIGTNIIKDLRDDMFRRLQAASFGFLDVNPTGDLISRNTSDINLLKQLLSSQLAFFIRQCLTLFLSIILMFYINAFVAFYATLTIPIIFIIMIIYRRKIYPIFAASRGTYGDLTSVVQENITGMRVVRAFAQEDREISFFKKQNDKYYDQHQELIFYQSSFDPLVRLFANISILIVIALGTSLALEDYNAMKIGDLFALIMLINFSIEPLFFISRFLGDMSKVGATCDRVVEILNNPLNEPNVNLPDLPSIQGVVEFDNVSLSYAKSEHYELKDISFKTKPGEQIAILGATGSGKSTLIRSIARFYEVSKGAIKIDGRDIRDFNIKSLRTQIGMVPQETFLFGRSIWDNLTLGNHKATEEEVLYATKLANIHEYIDSLPEKYNTVIGERGVTVSGGQKQRMAIARALIVKPRILILDDATSSVDVDTEFEIQQSFKEMFQNSTTFIITQRLSTVRNADRIIVLEHGRIQELGTHQELLDKPDGIYSKLYKTLKVEERASA
jgi:ATP-binding cassette subfamily B protein